MFCQEELANMLKKNPKKTSKVRQQCSELQWSSRRLLQNRWKKKARMTHLQQDARLKSLSETV